MTACSTARTCARCPRPLPDPAGDESAPAEPQWNITSIGADRVWNELGVTGQGIVVGQSDTGVDGQHPALRDGYRGRGSSGRRLQLARPLERHSPRPTDVGGHGTHTLGSAVGRGGIGVAPGAEWMGCVNLAATWPTRHSTWTACSSCWRPSRRAPTRWPPATRRARRTS